MKNAIFDVLQGTTPVDPAMLEDFLKEMNEKVMPEIVEITRERQRLAEESRHWLIL